MAQLSVLVLTTFLFLQLHYTFGHYSPSRNGLDKIYVRGNDLVDSDGRVLMFHGFNSVKKGPPWFDANILNVTRLKMMREWGFNVVRHGAMWAGAEPVEGRYDYAYIARLRQIVATLESYGMYSILDMHQDVLSSKFSSYDGVPRWLVDKFPEAALPYPWPLKNITDENWADGYLTYAVSLAFQEIYDNISGATDSFCAFWKTIAQAFEGATSVLGYELINEPWAGNVYRDPTLLLPGIAGRKNLVPLYEKLSAAIRGVNREAVIFYEPVTWSVFVGGDGGFGSGFASVPGGPEYRNRSVLSYHYYCWILGLNSSVPYPLWERIVCDDLMGTRIIPNVVNEIAGKLGGGAFLTEFGLCAPDGDPKSINTIECEFVLAQADKHFQSWTYWDSNFFDDTSGEPRWNTVLAFARVYPRAVAGTQLSMTLDPKDKQFRLEFKLDVTIKASTEIFIPRVQYPKGFLVELSKGLSWKFDENVSIIYVTNLDLKTAQVVFVNIHPSSRQ